MYHAVIFQSPSALLFLSLITSQLLARSLALDLTRALFYLLATVSSDFANCTDPVLGLFMSTWPTTKPLLPT